MRKVKGKQKILAVLMCVGLVLQGLPLEGLAAEVDSVTETAGDLTEREMDSGEIESWTEIDAEVQGVGNSTEMGEQEDSFEAEEIVEVEKSNNEEEVIENKVSETSEVDLEAESENGEIISEEAVLQEGEVLSGQCGDNLTWKIEDGTLTISGTGDMWDYDGAKFAPWRNYCIDNSVKLYISSGVTSIGYYAFGNCNGLIGNLIIPNSVTSIDDYAFFYCSGFSGDLVIPSSVTSIGKEAFAGCGGFDGKLEISDNVTSIGQNAFVYCSGFSGDLVIPSSVINIEYGAFGGCSGFDGNLVISNGVRSIEEGAFMECDGFKGKLIISDSVTSIGKSAFQFCSGFSGDLVIPSSVISIEDDAFWQCSGFNGNLVISNGVTSIGEYAFIGCSGFSGNLVIPNSITNIGEGAFALCSGFDGNLTISNKVTSIEYGVFDRCSKLSGNLVIPSSVRSIGENAFWKCSGFSGDLVIPDSVTSIGHNAFLNCKGFNGNLIISNKVTSIGEGAFQGCSGLIGKIIIPNNISVISDGMFWDCLSLEDAYISKTVVEIINNPFQYYDTNKKQFFNIPITFHCPKNSYAYNWAVENGFKVVEWNGTSTSDNKIAAVVELVNGKATVSIYDSVTKKPIKDAAVTIDKTTQTTNTLGLAFFPSTNTATQKEVKVTADGYNETTTYQIVKNKTSIRIGMTPVSDKLKITTATGYIGAKTYDLLRSKAVVGYREKLAEMTDTTYETILISVKSNKNNVTYTLLAGNKKIADSTTGDFRIDMLTSGKTENETITTKIPVTDLIEPGQTVFVKAVAADGSSVTTKLNLSTTHNYETEEVEKKKFEGKIGDKISAQIPEDIPFIGGEKIEFGFPDAMPIEMEINENGKIRVAYNKPANINMDKFSKKYKDLESKAERAIKLDSNIAGVKTFSAGMFDVSGKVCGYGEGNISELYQGKMTIKLGLMAEIEGKAGYKQYWVIAFIPVNLFVEGSVKGSVSGEIAFTVENWKMTEFDFCDGSFNVTVQLEAGGGVGFGYEIDASLVGQMNYVNKPARKYQKLWLEASGKVKRTLLWCHEKTLWESKKYKYTIFEKGKDVNPAPLNLESQLSDNNFTIADRAYLNYAEGYNAFAQVHFFAANNAGSSQNTRTIIKKAVLPSTAARLVAVNGEKYLFWADDVVSRNPYNRAALMYSKSKDGVIWSAPKKLIPEAENNTLDGAYDVYVKDKNIYLVWQDETRQLSKEDRLEDAVQSLSVRYAVLDTTNDTITENSCLTTQVGYYMYPCAVAAGDECYFAYVHNTLDSGDLEGNNTHHLYYLSGKDSAAKEVTLPDKAQVVNMDAGIFAGNASLVCELDMDGDANTDADREIYLYHFENNTFSRVTNNSVHDTMPVIADSGKVYWFQQNDIVCLEELGKAEKSIWKEPQISYQAVFSVETDDAGNDTILWEANDVQAQDGSVAIFQTSENADGSWGNVVKFAETTGTIASRISAAGSGDRLQVAHTEGVFLEDGTELKDLCVTVRETVNDLVVESVDFDEEAVIAGSKLPLKVEVTNNGNTVVNKITILVNDEKIETLDSVELAPFERKEILINSFTVPQSLSKAEHFTLQLFAENEQQTADNTVDLLLGCSDVYVETLCRVDEERTWIDIHVLNNTPYSASGKMLLHKDSQTGEVIYEEDFENIDADSGFAYSTDLGDYEDKSTRYYVELLTDEEENAVGNNLEFVYTGYGTGVEAEEQDDGEKEILAITLDTQKTKLAVGEMKQLHITTDDNAVSEQRDILWVSSDSRIAGVSQDGLITGYRDGSTEITAYYGDLSAVCEVVVGNSGKRSKTGMWIEDISDQIYTGKAIQPEIKVYDGETLLQEKKDYTISYKNNIKVNDAQTAKTAPTITVTGKGNYTGKETAVFQILPKDISDEDIEIDDITLSYNKKIQKPTPVISWNGKKLKAKTDFLVQYTDSSTQAYQSVGSYKILVSGTGNFSGQRELEVTITDNKLITKMKVGKIANQSYTGKAIKPEITLKDGKTLLKQGTDYTLEYRDNTDIGKARVTIVGMGDYSGKKQIFYNITGGSVAKAKVEGLNQKVPYTGSAITQNCKLTIMLNGSTKTLKKDTDYTVSYVNNIHAGKATVIFKGINGFSGTLKQTFTIEAFDISDQTSSRYKITLPKTVPYAKGGSIPKPVITFREKTLCEGIDYTLRYKNNKEITDNAVGGKKTQTKIPQVIIKGKGNYKGTRSLDFQISTQDISNLTLNAADKTYQNKSGSYITKVEVVDVDGKKLSAGKDYDKNLIYTYAADTKLSDTVVRKAEAVVEKNDIIPAGTVIRVSAVAKGSYKGTISGTYRITKSDISKASVKVADQIYTGNPIEPDKTDLTVKLGEKKVDNDCYEIVKYDRNVSKGKATLTIKGVGDYGGVKTVPFTIKSKGFLWWWRKK